VAVAWSKLTSGLTSGLKLRNKDQPRLAWRAVAHALATRKGVHHFCAAGCLKAVPTTSDTSASLEPRFLVAS